jgi:hypothetical protein
MRGVPARWLGHLHGSRLPPKGRGEKLPPRNGETPRLNPGRLRRVTLAALSLCYYRPFSPFTAWAVRPGAPKVRP